MEELKTPKSQWAQTFCDFLDDAKIVIARAGPTVDTLADTTKETVIKLFLLLFTLIGLYVFTAQKLPGANPPPSTPCEKPRLEEDSRPPVERRRKMLQYVSNRERAVPYVLTIREQGHSWAGRSPVTSVHESRAGAEAELLDYVKRNWEAEMTIKKAGAWVTNISSSHITAVSVVRGGCFE